MHSQPERLTVKELAHHLRRTTRYVYGMRRVGFRKIGGTATLAEALAFLEKTPHPTAEERKLSRRS